MSLMDTIKGAREEAGTNVAGLELPGRQSKQGGDASAEQTKSSQGFTRRSTAKAKPRRQQAAGVRRVASNGKVKSKKDMTKEEAKAERKHDREVSDLRYNVRQKLLEEKEEYQAAHKVWMRFLIAGCVCMGVAVALYLVVSNMGTNAPEILGILGLLVMVAAYATLIIGMIYDWRRIRPLRREVDSYVDSMSEKRLVTAINKAPRSK